MTSRIAVAPGRRYTRLGAVMVKLITRDREFFDAFERQSRCAVEAAALLRSLVHDFTDVAAKVQAIKDVEHQGDALTHELFTLLNKRFVTPLDREDIHDLASRLDDVLDDIDAVAADLRVYRIGQPTSECRAFADVIADTVEATDQAVRSLRTLDRGFHGLAVEVNRHENRADQLLRQSLAALFDEGANPIEVLKWKDIYETMEAVTDRCEDVANVLEAIFLKSA